MVHDLNIKLIKSKAKQHISIKDENAFDTWFDNEGVYDFMENPDDYIAEGLVNQYILSNIKDSDED